MEGSDEPERDQSLFFQVLTKLAQVRKSVVVVVESMLLLLLKASAGGVTNVVDLPRDRQHKR